jgi:hypothetical protein
MTDTDPAPEHPPEEGVGPGPIEADVEVEDGEDDGPALPNLAVRFFQVFVSPGELFARLQHRPAWFGAVALGGALVALAAYLLPAELMLEVARQQFIERGQEIPPGFESGAGFIRLAGVIFGPVFWALFAVITSGIVTVIFTFLLGGEGTFKQYFSFVSHAYLVSAVGNLALVPLRISTGDPQLLLSVGTLVPIGGEEYLGNFLGLLDLFGLWTWVVVGVGVAIINKKQTWASATAILMVIPVGLAAIFAIFA